MMAGLGGGSADGAAVLSGLNLLTGANLPLEQLEKIAVALRGGHPLLPAGRHAARPRDWGAVFPAAADARLPHPYHQAPLWHQHRCGLCPLRQPALPPRRGRENDTGPANRKRRANCRRAAKRPLRSFAPRRRAGSLPRRGSCCSSIGPQASSLGQRQRTVWPV